MTLRFYSDGEGRHLVCVPYTIANLHRMAKALNIKRCWFHNTPSGPHYDIPKRRITEVVGKTRVVPTQTILAITKGQDPLVQDYNVGVTVEHGVTPPKDEV